MKVILFIDRLFEKFSSWMLIAFLGVMIVMAFGQVVLRNFFHTSVDWGDVFLRHMVLWVGFFGAVIATGEGRHLKIEFVSKLVPRRVRKVFFIITSFFASGICYLLMRASISFLQLEAESASTLILDLPLWYFVVIIPAGYAMVSFRFLARSLQWSVEVFNGNWEIKEGHH